MTTQRNSFMYIFGAVVIAVVALYYGFLAIDTFGLAEHEGIGRVVDKEFHEAGRTYSRQVVGGRAQTLVQARGAMYVLKLRIGDKEGKCGVTEDVYKRVKKGSRLRVTYEEKRITGSLRITGVGG